MTVLELIEELEKMPQDKEVVYYYYNDPLEVGKMTYEAPTYVEVEDDKVVVG